MCNHDDALLSVYCLIGSAVIHWITITHSEYRQFMSQRNMPEKRKNSVDLIIHNAKLQPEVPHQHARIINTIWILKAYMYKLTMMSNIINCTMC